MVQESLLKKFARYALAVVVTVVALVLALKLWRLELDVPLVYSSGDVMASLFGIKTILDHGWYLHNPSLGAPFSLLMHDFPMADTFNFLLIKLLTMLFPSVGATVNLFYFLTFVLTTLSGFFVMRHFRVGTPIALAAAVLYSFMPYHFWRGLSHLYLSAYYMVPIITLLVLETWSDSPPLTANGRLVWNARTFWTIVACVLIGSTGVYYAFFGCILLGLAALARLASTRQLRSVLPGFLLAGMIGTTVVLNVLPSSFFNQQHGKNLEVAHRNPVEAEIYGMKVAQLLMPVGDHRFAAMRAIGSKYQGFPLPNEATETLGLIGSFGFLVLMARRLKLGSMGNAISERLSVMNLSAVMLATIGGFGTLFALFVSPSIRSYNRISIMIAFFCLFEIALLLDWLRRRHFANGWRSHAFSLGMVGVLGFGLLDQTLPAFVPHYEATRHEFQNDRRFVKAIEASVPDQAMIFQLPAAPFPENPPIHKMGDYELFRGYLHSEKLRWSYGAMKGRNHNWHQWVARKPLEQMLPAIAAAGFQGLYVDRKGFEDEGKDLDRKLRAALKTRPLESENGRLAYYDLTNYLPEFKRQHPEPEIAAYRAMIAGLSLEASTETQAMAAQVEFDQLVEAGRRYLEGGRKPVGLDPRALVEAGLLPGYGGGSDPSAGDHNWTPTGGWVGYWQPGQFGVGKLGSYAAMAPLVERYRSQALEVYFPYPRVLDGTPNPRERGQLLIVFPTPGGR